jgi:hypothetical protein
MNTDLLTGVTLYPNPATTKVRVTARESIKTITILTLTGREVIRRLGCNKPDELIQIGLLPRGLYHVKVVTDKNVSNTLLYKAV